MDGRPAVTVKDRVSSQQNKTFCRIRGFIGFMIAAYILAVFNYIDLMCKYKTRISDRLSRPKVTFLVAGRRPLSTLKDTQ